MALAIGVSSSRRPQYLFRGQLVSPVIYRDHLCRFGVGDRRGAGHDRHRVNPIWVTASEGQDVWGAAADTVDIDLLNLEVVQQTGLVVGVFGESAAR